jgi:hypothetical protein
MGEKYACPDGGEPHCLPELNHTGSDRSHLDLDEGEWEELVSAESKGSDRNSVRTSRVRNFKISSGEREP